MTTDPMTRERAFWILQHADAAIDQTYECDFEGNYLDPEWQARQADTRRRILRDVAAAKAFLDQEVTA